MTGDDDDDDEAINIEVNKLTARGVDNCDVAAMRIVIEYEDTSGNIGICTIPVPLPPEGDDDDDI